MIFVVWDDTPYSRYNACKLVQKVLLEDQGIHMDISCMSVQVCHVDEDRLEVTVPDNSLCTRTQLGWTPESKYSHSKQSWYDFNNVHELMEIDTDKFFITCDADKMKVLKRRVKRYLLVGGQYTLVDAYEEENK